jgi:hypothetical protein
MMDNGRLAVEQKAKVLLFLKKIKSVTLKMMRLFKHISVPSGLCNVTDLWHFKEMEDSVLEGRLPGVLSSWKTREL